MKKELQKQCTEHARNMRAFVKEYKLTHHCVLVPDKRIKAMYALDAYKMRGIATNIRAGQFDLAYELMKALPKYPRERIPAGVWHFVKKETRRVLSEQGSRWFPRKGFHE